MIGKLRNSEVTYFGDHDVTGNVVARTRNFIAIYNVAPIVPGHCLVIPRRRASSLYDLSDTECRSFFSFARRFTEFLLDFYACDAFDWSLQDGKEAGQTVDHLHLHVIPRRPKDFSSDEDWYRSLLINNLDSSRRAALSSVELEMISTNLWRAWKMR